MSGCNIGKRGERRAGRAIGERMEKDENWSDNVDTTEQSGGGGLGRIGFRLRQGSGVVIRNSELEIDFPLSHRHTTSAFSLFSLSIFRSGFLRALPTFSPCTPASFLKCFLLLKSSLNYPAFLFFFFLLQRLLFFFFKAPIGKTNIFLKNHLLWRWVS